MNWTKSEVERIDHLLSSTPFNEAVRIAAKETRRSESSVRYMAKRRAYFSKQAGFLDKKVEDSGKKQPTSGKVLALFDVHWGFEEDGTPMHIELSSVLKFAKAFRPDLLLLCGDIIDNATFSHWLSGNMRRQRSLPLAKDMYNSFNEGLMSKLRGSVGDSCFIYYLLGNHEDWANQSISRTPNGDGYWNVEANVKYVDAFLPYGGNKHVKVGKLYYMHGECLNRYHAAAVANSAMRAVRYSHTHTIQSYVNISSLDSGDFHIAQSCGCLCNRAPSYARGRPNSWVHAFNYAIVNPDGTYYDFTPVLNPDLSFRAEGVTYRV